MSYARPAESWVLEGIMTTLSPSRELNVAPMGPIVTGAMDHLVLRPFNTSTTYTNLKASGQGVFHVTDDVLLLAKAALGAAQGQSVRPAEKVDGMILTGACRYYEIQVESLDDQSERVTIEARVVHAGIQREFFGFNRAKHAVLEAAILATRVHLIGAAAVLEEMEGLEVIVEKTGGGAEREAMELLKSFIKGREHGH